MNSPNFLKLVFMNTKELLKNNKEEVHKFNQQIVPKVFIITVLTLFIPIISAIFSESMRQNVPAYVLTMVTLLGLLGLSKIPKLKPYPLVFVYIFGLVVFALFLYLSIVKFPTRPAGSILTFFVVVPLLFIDHSFRINLYAFGMFVVHMILSFVFKGVSLGSVDLINTFTSVILGMLIGRLFLITRLKQFETEKQLKIERETDFLTQLYNRRKLYMDLNCLDQTGYQEVGTLIIDLDHFKEFNDLYGHLTGDRCLQEFGKLLQSVSKANSVKFYRLGGEEFVGITLNMSKEEIMQLAEEIRMSVKALNIAEKNLTLSIGISIIPIKKDQSVDYYLEGPDKALYKAKELGRDKIELWD